MMSETTEWLPDEPGTEEQVQTGENKKVFKSSYELKQEAVKATTDLLTSPPICDVMSGEISVSALMTKLYGYRQTQDGNYLPEIIPYNIASGKSYDMLNQLILLQADKEDSRWMTFDQAKDRGSFIKKGTAGTRIFARKEEANFRTGEKKYVTRSFVVFNAADIKSVNPQPRLKPNELSAVASDGFFRLEGYCRKIDDGMTQHSAVQVLQNYADQNIPATIEDPKQRGLISALFAARKMAEFMQPVSETATAYNFLKLNKSEIDEKFVDTAVFNANRLSYQFDKATGLDEFKKISEAQRIVYPPKLHHKKSNEKEQER